MLDDYNIIVPQATTYEQLIEWRTADDEIVDLTGAQAILEVKKNERENGPAAITKTDTSGITINPTEGSLVIKFDPGDTKNLGCGQYRYSLLVKLAGDVTRLAQGLFVVEPTVTRSFP